ncbi:metal ABC transporter solute-binding protein, Zn/Mn family [Bifidobacterium eulemuris]
MTKAFRNGFTRVMAVVAATAMLAGGAACGTTAADPSSGDRNASEVPTPNAPIQVVASVNQWGALAAQIGGDDVQVTSILSSTAVDAHDFEPQTADMTSLSTADVVVANGAGYDSWAAKNLGKSTTLVSAAQMVGAMEGDNPHLWFSRDARIAMAEELANEFSKQRPEQKDEFAARLKEFKAQEQELDDWMSDWMSSYTSGSAKPTYAATEAVAYYLMSDLGFEDLTPEGYAQAAAAEGEVAAADLQDFQELIESRGIDLLINNTQSASDATNMLTGTAGRSEVPVVDISEQMPEDAETLTDWIFSLVKQIASAVDPEYEGLLECVADADGTTDAGTQDGVSDGAESDGSGDSSSVCGTAGSSGDDADAGDDGDSGDASSTEGQTDPGK